MDRRTFIVQGGAAVGFSFVALGLEGEQSANKPIVATLGELIPQLMREANVPGLSICLVERGQMLWRHAFGFRDSVTKAPVTDETLFEAASISKTVFAYAVMKLCETGVLNLDRPLVKFGAPPLLEGDPRLEQITARHVLSHTSGIQDFRSRKEPLKIHFNPGEKFLYSGEGYYYLQSVVTHLTGRMDPGTCATYEAGFQVCGTDFDASMKGALLRPFGMNTSGYLWDDALARQAANPHDWSGKPSTKKKPKTPDVARYGACGGLHTTASEYARFLLEILNPKGTDAVRLRDESLKSMLTPQIRLPEDEKIDGADSWALGWAIQRRKAGNIIVHSGGQAGFQSLTMASVGRKSGFVILTNSDNGWKIFHDARFANVMDRLLTNPV